MINKMVKHPPSITLEPPATTVSVSSAKANSTKASRPGTTAAVNLNTRLPLKRHNLPSSRPTPVATRGASRGTPATRRRHPFCPRLHLFLRNLQLSPHRLPTGRSNMLTTPKAPSNPTLKSSPRAWTSPATRAASSDLGNCSLETLTGTVAALLPLLLLPLVLLLRLSLRRNFRWTATSWTNPAVMASAVVRGMMLGVRLLVLVMARAVANC
jgi:hypothetical protein